MELIVNPWGSYRLQRGLTLNQLVNKVLYVIKVNALSIGLLILNSYKRVRGGLSKEITIDQKSPLKFLSSEHPQEWKRRGQLSGRREVDLRKYNLLTVLKAFSPFI